MDCVSLSLYSRQNVKTNTQHLPACRNKDSRKSSGHTGVVSEIAEPDTSSVVNVQ